MRGSTDASPYTTSPEYANAAAARYAGGFDAALGRKPAAAAHARTTATRATTRYRDADLRDRSTRVYERMAAAGRNHATDQDPVVPPGASRASEGKEGRPVVEASPWPAPAIRSSACGRRRSPATIAPPMASPRPWRRRSPLPGTTNHARNRSAAAR